jgi:hypothetical protein
LKAELYGRGPMELEAVGVTQPEGHAYQVRFKFGKQAYFAIEVRRGEDSVSVAGKLPDLADSIAPKRPK